MNMDMFIDFKSFDNNKADSFVLNESIDIEQYRYKLSIEE